MDPIFIHLLKKPDFLNLFRRRDISDGQLTHVAFQNTFQLILCYDHPLPVHTFHTEAITADQGDSVTHELGRRLGHYMHSCNG